MAPTTDNDARNERRLSKKSKFFIGSRISNFLRPAQRYDDCKLNRITRQAAWHGKTEHGIFVKFKKPSKTAVVLIAGVSPTRVLRAPGTSSYQLVPKHLRVTWPRPEQSHLLPEACSPNSVKFKKPSKTVVVLIAGVTISGTPCPRHIIVPSWPRPKQSHLLPEACSPNGTDNRQQRRDERSVLRPNPATFLRDFTLYMTTKYAILRKMCLNYNACITH